MATFRIPKHKKKNVGEKRGKRKRLTLEMAEKMFDLYCKDWTISQIAKKFKIRAATIKKLIEKGDDRRGITPFAERRRTIVQATMAVNDANIHRRLYMMQVASGRMLAEASDRFLDRIQAARLLDNKELYEEGNEVQLAILNRKAYEPDTRDVESIMRMNQEAWDRGAKLAGLDGSDGPALQVNLTHNQGQSQHVHVRNSEQEAEAMDEVFSFMEKTGKNVVGNKAVAEMVKDASLAVEASEDDNQG